MGIKDIFNSVEGGVVKGVKSISDLFGNANYTRPKPVEPVYNIPSVIPPEHHNTFIEQAKLAGVTPDEFGMIAKREQGANTLPKNAAMVGAVDKTDKGLMQVNKVHDKLIQDRFKKELGRGYNPNDAADSIIAARMILEENRRQFEQMKANNTYTDPYTNQDLIDSYNTGVSGLVQAKKGDKTKQNRLSRYQSAGQN